MTTEQALKECQVFSTLSSAELAKIGSLAIEKEYDAGTTVIQEGNSAEELLVLQEGKVAIQMTLPRIQGQTSRKITVDLVNKNEVIGWSALVEPYVYTMSAICLQKVRTLSINGAKLRELLRNNHKIGYEVMKELIKVVASRLNDTRQVLISERLLPPQP